MCERGRESERAGGGEAAVAALDHHYCHHGREEQLPPPSVLLHTGIPALSLQLQTGQDADELEVCRLPVSSSWSFRMRRTQ